MLQFPHVAGPVVRVKNRQRFLAERDFGIPWNILVIFFHEMGDEGGNIFLALAQRRNLQGKNVEAEKQIPPEGAFLRHGVKVAVGGGDDAHVDVDDPVPADAENFLFLQGAQQAHLCGKAHFADLVQKQRAPVGQFKHAGLAALARPGKGPFFVAEELAFEQMFGQGRAVQSHKGASVPLAEVVYALGKQLFAGAGFAFNKDGGGAVRIAFGLGHHLPQRAFGADDVRKIVFGHQPLAGQLHARFRLDLLDFGKFLKNNDGALVVLAHTNGHAVDHQGFALERQHLVHGVFAVAEHLLEFGGRGGAADVHAHNFFAVQVQHLLGRSVANGHGLITVDGNDATERIIDDVVEAARACALLDMLINNISGRKHGLVNALLAGTNKIVGQAVLRCLFNDATAETHNGNVLERGKAGNDAVEILFVAVDDLAKVFQLGKGCQRFDVFAQVAVVGDAKQVVITVGGFAQRGDDVVGGYLDGHHRRFDHLLNGDGRSRLADDDVVPVFHFQRVQMPVVVYAAVEHINFNAELLGGMAHKLGHFFVNGNAKNAWLETGGKHG